MRVAALGLALAVSAIAPAAARAQDAAAHPRATAPDASAEREVVVVLRAHPEDASAMSDVLRELLARHRVRTTVRRVETIDLAEVLERRDDATALARVFVDLRAHPELRLYVTDRTADRILVRTLAFESGGVDEIARETVGHVVEATVEALLAGAPIGAPRERVRRELGLPTEPPVVVVAAPPEAPPASEPASPALSLGLGLAYRAELWLDEPPLHGPGVAIELRGRGATRGGARLSGFFVAPSEVRRELAGAASVGGAVALDALLDVSVSREVSLSAALGIAVELSHVVPLAGSGASVALGAPFTTATMLGRALLGCVVHPAPAVSVRVDLTFAVDLGDTRFSVQAADGPRAAFDPWLLRPGLQLTLIFEALGSPRG